MQVDLHPEARAELRAGALWYEERQDHLGDDFIAAVAVILQRISAAPESFPMWPGTRLSEPRIRKAVMGQFPYVIAFEQHDEFALVLGIAHQNRRPLYWLTRASQQTDR